MSESTGRPFNENELINQIGRMNVFAISGGRVGVIVNDDGETVEIQLPVSNGYRVSIKLGWDDTYTVSRQFVRKGTVSDKGTIAGVYCTEIGEVAYQASCFRSNDAFGKVA
jgi:hypothetical protein